MTDIIINFVLLGIPAAFVIAFLGMLIRDEFGR